MKNFLHSYFIYVAAMAIGMGMAIYGQVKFDYAKTDAGVTFGQIVGWTGLAVLIGSGVIIAVKTSNKNRDSSN